MNNQSETQGARIPGALRLVAGPFTEAIFKIWAGSVAEYLTVTDQRRHVWHACLSAESCNFSPEREDADALYRRLSSWKAKDLILQAYGSRPRGLVPLLGRLPAGARSPAIYRALVEIMERGGPAAKLLMHTGDPSDVLIETLAVLPDRVSWRSLSAALPIRDDYPEDLALLMWTLERAHQILPKSNVWSVLKEKKPLSAFLTLMAQQTFPTPPWAGTPRLRPIRSGPELHDVGSRYENCLNRYDGVGEVLRVLNGTKYFYEWSGSERAIVELVRFNSIGWYASDVRARRNDDVSHFTRRELTREFSLAPNICPMRLSVRSHIYPSSRIWGVILSGGAVC
jgi:hypothetical protein